MPTVINGYYTHYKNPDHYYAVISVSPNRTRPELTQVVYMALYTDQDGVFGRIHTRDEADWLSPVDRPGFAPSQITRFPKVSDGDMKTLMALDRLLLKALMAIGTDM